MLVTCLSLRPVVVHRPAVVAMLVTCLASRREVTVRQFVTRLVLAHRPVGVALLVTCLAAGRSDKHGSRHPARSWQVVQLGGVAGDVPGQPGGEGDSYKSSPGSVVVRRPALVDARRTPDTTWALLQVVPCLLGNTGGKGLPEPTGPGATLQQDMLRQRCCDTGCEIQAC